MGATSILNWFGTLAPFGVAVILFAETGILLGIFLPGDSLLITAGLWAANTAGHHAHPNIVAVVIGAAIGALAGAQVGYLLGRRAGPHLFNRPDSRLFKRAWVERAEEVFNRYGPAKAIVLARFIPGVRTLMNPVAGILEVDGRVFLTWQAVGGLVWSVGVTLAAYAVGQSLHNLDHYLIPIVLVIVVLSLVPVGVEVLRARRRTRSPAA